MTLKNVINVFSLAAITEGLFLYFSGATIASELYPDSISNQIGAINSLRPFGAFKIGVGFFVFFLREENSHVLIKVLVGNIIMTGMILLHIFIDFLVFNDPPPLGLLVINSIYLTLGLVAYFNKKKFNT